MKTYKHLYAQVASFENVCAAYYKARAGKRKFASVAHFEYHQESELLNLVHALQQGSWQPGPYHSFYIHDPKKRLISAAPFRDRVVHHALVNIIEPLWERRFIFDTYANRVGKGTHRAVARAQEFARQYPYVLQGDIQQFFPAIDHELLKQTLAQVIHDEQVLRLCAQIIASGQGLLEEEYQMKWFASDDLLAAIRPRGLPIGNLTSQFWANVYLNKFDHFVKRELKCAGYLRYVDDFLLFSQSKAQLTDWRATLISFLATLRLTLHEPQAQCFPVTTGIPFLGFRVYPTHRRLKQRKGIHFQRHLKKLLAQFAAHEIDLTTLHASVRGWVNHVRYGDTFGLRRAILGQARIMAT